MASGLVRQLIAFHLVIGLLAGCTMVHPITRDEEFSIQRGERVLILLRIIALVDGVPHAASLQDMTIGLGSFDTVGKVTRIDTRCLSEETREQGWLFFVLEPEVYYLAFHRGHHTGLYHYNAELQTAQKWRIDVPENASSIYIGTLLLRCRSVPTFSFIRDGCVFIDDLYVINEEEVARRVVADHVPGIGQPETVLMERHGPPTIILRVPKSKM